MDESGQHVLGNLPLLGANGNSTQLNDFISYCISKIDDNITDDIQILKDSGNNITSEIDQTYIGRIPLGGERNKVSQIVPNGVRFGITKEDGENVGVFTSKSDFPDSNVRPPRRALAGQPFLLIKSASGQEVTVPIFTPRYNEESSQINGTLTYFDQEVRKTVENIINRSNKKEVDTQIALNAMNRLNELFSSQDFHINAQNGIITDIHIGGSDASTETTRQPVYTTQDGLLNVDRIVARLKELNLPINIDLKKINTTAKLGGVNYNTAIAQMAESNLIPNSYHTIDDWFTIKPVVDGKMIGERSEKFVNPSQVTQNTVSLPNGSVVDRQTWTYNDSMTGDVYNVDDDVNKYLNDNDKDAEKRLLDRAMVYAKQRLQSNQDIVLHLNIGQLRPLDYDVKKNKLIDPSKPKARQSDVS